MTVGKEQFHISNYYCTRRYVGLSINIKVQCNVPKQPQPNERLRRMNERTSRIKEHTTYSPANLNLQIENYLTRR